jgi:ribosomal protein S19E (S16A)
LKRKAEAENTTTITSNTVKSIFKVNDEKESREIKNTARTGVAKARAPTIPEAKPVTRAASTVKKVGVVAKTVAKKTASGFESRNKTSAGLKAASVPVAPPAPKKRKEYDIKVSWF